MARNGLRELSRRFPSPSELRRTFDALRDDTDRSVAIVAASIADNVLEQLLLTHMERATPDLIAMIFGMRGPLSDFHSKILIAGAFGVVSANMAKDLNRIRAHSKRLRPRDHGGIIFDARNRRGDVRPADAQRHGRSDSQMGKRSRTDPYTARQGRLSARGPNHVHHDRRRTSEEGRRPPPNRPSRRPCIAERSAWTAPFGGRTTAAIYQAHLRRPDALSDFVKILRTSPPALRRRLGQFASQDVIPAGCATLKHNLGACAVWIAS